ncbi:MFS-type transporter involved in bile tolerance (Atg22 family) [Nonomuraea fuscirosea]|uniref:MFS-type transporter involved in bile tolerance (Atg22 family) n=1 Tax=Nonomuraea fuscirosea TaxID=1291556 RepID=A0A2T0N3V7_9ACTN|nr:MFS transporter [Nonomuraea fuscirosea]PRX66818.1 MFS-type transporter involved in bile tolerance (Atg22 family) [Nonomuraea fuscirosea]
MSVFKGNSPFLWSWAGSTLSVLGSRTIGVTYPLLAYGLTQSATSIAWVMFASTVPGLLWYIPAGAWIDRIGPRRVMVWSEFLRGTLVMGIVVAQVAGVLELRWLLIVALLEGTLSVHSSVAETVLIPSTVKPDKVENALALHEASVHGMVLAGRPLGGLLYGVSPIVSFITNAAMLFGAAASLSRVPRDITGRGKPLGAIFGEMRGGLTELRRNRFLCSATLITAYINFMVQGMIVVFLSEATDDNLPSALAGTILAASGVGGVIGAITSLRRGRTGRRFRHRPVMLVHLWACTIALAIPLLFLQASWSFAVALLIIGLAGGLSNVTMRTVLSQAPLDRAARVAAVSRLGSYSAVALGPLLAGLLVGQVESWVALFILCVPMGGLALAMTTVPRLRSALVSVPRLEAAMRETETALRHAEAAVRTAQIALDRTEVVVRRMDDSPNGDDDTDPHVVDPHVAGRHVVGPHVAAPQISASQAVVT